MLNKADFCFILLPGFSPDDVPVKGIKADIEKLGYAAVAANFWGVKPRGGHAPGGNDPAINLSTLTIEECKSGVTSLIDKARQKYKYVVGIGISLGGALLLEHAKEHDDLFCVVSVGTPFSIKNETTDSNRLKNFSSHSLSLEYFQPDKKVAFIAVARGENGSRFPGR